MDALIPPAMLQGSGQNALVPSPPTPAQQMATLQPLPPPPVTHDVTIVTTRKLARARVLGVPPEEFGIERAARDIKTCNYCFHEVLTKTRGQLIDEGFNKDQVLALTAYSGQSPNNVEQLSRDSVQEHFISSSDVDPLMQLVRITEHYIRMDYEGRGRPCIYMVVTGGDQADILKKNGKELIEPVDVMPFATTTPVPITHRFFGRSIADLIMPVQREKTALKRGALDNLYLHNNPRVEVSEQNAGPNTLDDLLVSRPGGVVRTRTPGGLNWQSVPDITTSIYPMLQYLDAEMEARTGLAKQTQGIDANALQNQSATAVAQVFSASQMRIKLVARILAEGVRDIFTLLHHTIRTHGSEQAQTVRLRNQWVSIDPRNWKTRDDMTINVGLGTGGKAQQFAQQMAIANVQKELVMAGKANMVDDAKLYNSAAELTRIMGHKNPDRFFNDPDAKDPQTGQLLHPPLPPPPDPKVQIEQTKANSQMQLAQAKQQSDQEKAKTDALHQQIKATADIEVAKVKAELDAKIALVEAQLKQNADERAGALHAQEMAHQRELHHQKMAQSAQQHGHTIESKQLEQKGKHAKAYPQHATVDHVAQLHGAMAAHAKAISDMSSAPVEIIRDPKTGKATGMRRVMGPQNGQ